MESTGETPYRIDEVGGLRARVAALESNARRMRWWFRIVAALAILPGACALAAVFGGRIPLRTGRVTTSEIVLVGEGGQHGRWSTDGWKTTLEVTSPATPWKAKLAVDRLEGASGASIATLVEGEDAIGMSARLRAGHGRSPTVEVNDGVGGSILAPKQLAIHATSHVLSLGNDFDAEGNAHLRLSMGKNYGTVEGVHRDPLFELDVRAGEKPNVSLSVKADQVEPDAAKLGFDLGMRHAVFSTTANGVTWTSASAVQE